MAIALFSPESGTALATVVGRLVEVPKTDGSHLNTVSLTVSWPANTIFVLTAGAVGPALGGTPDAD